MLITLEVLEEENACSRGVKYFKSLEKKEWGVVELIKRCHKDCKPCLIVSLYECIDSNDELREVVRYLIETKGHFNYTFFRCCGELLKDNLELFEEVVRYQMENGWKLQLSFSYYRELFKNNIKLFEEVVRYQMKNGWDLDDFLYCSELLKDNLELFEEVVRYQMEKEFDFEVIFKYYSELFKNNVKLFEKVVRYQMKNGWDLGYALSCSYEAFTQLPELYEEAKLYQEELWKKYSKM